MSTAPLAAARPRITFLQSRGWDGEQSSPDPGDSPTCLPDPDPYGREWIPLMAAADDVASWLLTIWGEPIRTKRPDLEANSDHAGRGRPPWPGGHGYWLAKSSEPGDRRSP